jgi:hypothetical protein
MRAMLMVAGFLFGVFNSMPFSWRVRVFWMRTLYEVIVVFTQLFPSILRWTQNQNIRFKMGKQEGEDYESLVMLERVLEFFEKNDVTPEQVHQAVEQAETLAIPGEKMATYLARSVLDPLTAERLISKSLQTGRY